MLPKALLVLACAASTLGGVPRTLGPHSKSDGKIIGGTPAVVGEIPWQASLQDWVSQHFCSGTVISNRWLITSARCSAGLKPEDVRVSFGGISTIGWNHYAIARIVVHDGYNPLTKENDIALWRFTTQINLDENMAPISLHPPNRPTPPGLATIVSGWGTTSNGGDPSSDVLLKVDAPVLERQEECAAAYADLGGTFPGQICAGDVEGEGFCLGDDGGPLFLDGYLYGIVSWSNGCGSPGFPGIYTEINPYREWITNVTGI